MHYVEISHLVCKAYQLTAFYMIRILPERYFREDFHSTHCWQSEKIKLNFYFHTSLWCLKRFYEGLKGLHKGKFHIKQRQIIGTWKALKAFIKPFEAAQRSVKTKI